LLSSSPDEIELHEQEAHRVFRDSAHARLGRRLKMLVGKPGFEGHSNGAEQIAVAARDSGIEVVYEGIRLTPASPTSPSRNASTSSASPSSPARTCP
jgi:methylmalonyl-CoA mutase cobalamin-binding subunit